MTNLKLSNLARGTAVAIRTDTLKLIQIDIIENCSFVVIHVIYVGFYPKSRLASISCSLEDSILVAATVICWNM